MATTESPFGIDHPTVVPTNFDPEQAQRLQADRNGEE